MTDAESTQEPGSLAGDVEPSGAGEWVAYGDAAARWKIDRKAVYRRVRRGKALGRKNPETGDAEVWIPGAGEPKQEPRSLVAPDQSERFAVALEASIGRALSPLTEALDRQQARIEELIRENERLKLEREQRSLWGELWERIRRQLGYN